MIWKAEPEKVLRFITDNFELLRDLYRAQLADNVVHTVDFDRLARHTGEVTTRRLFEYKLLQRQYDDIRLSEPLRAFLAYLLNEYKPLLPEELEKYRLSLDELYERISQPGDNDPVLLAERLDALYDEVQRFMENVENNTSQLLRATQQLKSNREQMPYSERIRRARHLIEHYIEPLNRILDVQQPQSIANVLTRISAFVNVERFHAVSPRLGDRFAQLHELLREADRRIVGQSRILTRELLPLLDRLQTESEILTGWLYFLERPFQRPAPPMPARRHLSLTGRTIGSELRLFLQQFVERPPAVLLPESAATASNANGAYFDRRAYRSQLDAALPLDDYFRWCGETLYERETQPSTERFFRICSLLFEEGNRYALEFQNARTRVSVDGHQFDMPQIRVTQSTN